VSGADTGAVLPVVSGDTEGAGASIGAGSDAGWSEVCSGAGDAGAWSEVCSGAGWSEVCSGAVDAGA
jgi:hypothetical protein